MGKEITIYDIAKELNLSPSTVSRALQDHASVKKITKKKVTDMANQLGYRSNMYASILRKQRSNIIGVILPELDNDFMASVISGMEKVANEVAYNLIISQSLGLIEKEVANAKAMYNSRVDGLLVSVTTTTDTIKHFDPFISKNIPVIFYDCAAPDHLKCTGIVIDNIQAAYKATIHLIEEGCKNIVHITGSLDRKVYSDRLKGFQYAIINYELPFVETNLIINNLSEAAGIMAAQHILNMNPRPDGIFVSNDTCAVHLMKALIQAGISIPHDMAIVGFNNDPVSRVVEPELTTVEYPGSEMGEVAMRTLINHLNGISDLSVTNSIILRSDLIKRKSSLRASKKTC